MSSRLFDGDEAVRLNLLAEEVDDLATLDQRVQQEVEPYLSCAPGAVADAKALIHALSRQIDDAVIAHTVAALAERWTDSEAQEGINAFFERRKPQWNKG
jgi:methylglutaconyl-CoA hydratase